MCMKGNAIFSFKIEPKLMIHDNSRPFCLLKRLILPKYSFIGSLESMDFVII